MTVPRTWAILQGFETCLQRISVANGYFTDAGASVTLEPKPITTRDAISVAIIWNGKRRPEDPAMRRAGGFLNGVTVEVRIAADRDNAQLLLHSIVDDVEKALDGQKAAFDSNTTFPQSESTDTVRPADGLPWVGANILFTNHSKPRS